jgi:hypothetical protein
MTAEHGHNRRGAPSRRSPRAIGSLLLCSLALVAGVTQASAGGVEPAPGGWKGKTAQHLALYFGVREGRVVTNVRLSYRDAICGKASIHNRTVTLNVDESGHFAGIVYPANGGVELEGTFTGPRQVKGKIVAGESSGLPGCLGGKFSFTAAPKP